MEEIKSNVIKINHTNHFEDPNNAENFETEMPCLVEIAFGQASTDARFGCNMHNVELYMVFSAYKVSINRANGGLKGLQGGTPLN